MVGDNSQTIDRIKTWLTAKVGESDQKEPILKLVEKVLERYKNEVRNFSPPIDLNALGNCLDIKVKQIILSKKINSYALLIPIVDGFKIELKDEEKFHNAFRTRYSCAHEMAHTFFYKIEEDGMPSRGVPGGSEYEEKLCDLAAAEFLMPEEIFKIKSDEIIKKHGYSFVGLMKLRDIFKTSLQSIIIKAVNNGWQDYLIAKWNPIYDNKGSITRFEKEWNFSIDGRITMPEIVYKSDQIFKILEDMIDNPGNTISKYNYEKELSIKGTRVMLLNDGYPKNLTFVILIKVSEYFKYLQYYSDFSENFLNPVVLDFNFEERNKKEQNRVKRTEMKNLVDFM